MCTKREDPEESEIEARKLSPDEAATSAAVSAIQNLSERQAQREEELIRQQRSMFEMLMRWVSPATTTEETDAAVPSIPPPPRGAFAEWNTAEYHDTER